jgi:hypothetical protein
MRLVLKRYWAATSKTKKTYPRRKVVLARHLLDQHGAATCARFRTPQPVNALPHLGVRSYDERAAARYVLCIRKEVLAMFANRQTPPGVAL